MSSQVVREFRYRPNRLTTAALFALALFGFFELSFFARYAVDTPVQAFGFELTPAQFQAIMLAFLPLGAIGALALAALLVYSFIGKSRITFTNNSIVIPKPTRLGVSSQILELPFTEIRSVNVKPFMGATKLLEIVHASGRACLASNMFPSKQDFEAACTLLSTAMANNRP